MYNVFLTTLYREPLYTKISAIITLKTRSQSDSQHKDFKLCEGDNRMLIFEHLDKTRS